MRRLLTTAEVAQKLGYSTGRFAALRAQLVSARRFPLPVFGGGGRGRKARYDEGAIDAWLDAQMDPALRATRDTPRAIVHEAARDWEAVLEQRLQA